MLNVADFKAAVAEHGSLTAALAARPDILETAVMGVDDLPDEVAEVFRGAYRAQQEALARGVSVRFRFHFPED